MATVRPERKSGGRVQARRTHGRKTSTGGRYLGRGGVVWLSVETPRLASSCTKKGGEET